MVMLAALMAGLLLGWVIVSLTPRGPAQPLPWRLGVSGLLLASTGLLSTRGAPPQYLAAGGVLSVLVVASGALVQHLRTRAEDHVCSWLDERGLWHPLGRDVPWRSISRDLRRLGSEEEEILETLLQDDPVTAEDWREFQRSVETARLLGRS